MIMFCTYGLNTSLNFWYPSWHIGRICLGVVGSISLSRWIDSPFLQSNTLNWPITRHIPGLRFPALGIFLQTHFPGPIGSSSETENIADEQSSFSDVPERALMCIQEDVQQPSNTPSPTADRTKFVPTQPSRKAPRTASPRRVWK